MPPASFSKPPHLGPPNEGREALEDACELKYRSSNKPGMPPNEWSDPEWRTKIKVGYERLSQTLWHVAREFDVRGYGQVLREKLTTKWCDCGCSTDHLGEVCERTVREEEEENGGNVGKRREWDGRGSGVYGWDSPEEEDIWEVNLDFGALEPNESGDGLDREMTISELMEWRYLKAEREKEKVRALKLVLIENIELTLVSRVTLLSDGTSLMLLFSTTRMRMRSNLSYHTTSSTSQLHILNLISKTSLLYIIGNILICYGCSWMDAEKACTKALTQHKSSKGYYRRARAWKMLGQSDDALKGNSHLFLAHSLLTDAPRC